LGPIPNPQSPIPNPQKYICIFFIYLLSNILNIYLYYNISVLVYKYIYWRTYNPYLLCVLTLFISFQSLT
ncbi:MAG: hypothetical protein MJ252_19380, partial [archaeon]|nr:hypothetical protein [archaeon]